MLLPIWAALGALICGTVLATLPNGGMGTPAKIILLLGLVVALAAPIATRRQAASCALDDGGEIEPWRVATDEPASSDARIRAIALLARVDQHVLDGLRAESFERQWRDDSLRALRHGVSSDEAATAASDPGSRALTSAVTAFRDLYDEFTTPYPLVVHGRWRMLKEQDEAAPGEPDEPTPQAALTAAAAGVCQRYDDLLSFTKQGARISGD